MGPHLASCWRFFQREFEDHYRQPLDRLGPNIQLAICFFAHWLLNMARPRTWIWKAVSAPWRKLLVLTYRSRICSTAQHQVLGQALPRFFSVLCRYRNRFLPNRSAVFSIKPVYRLRAMYWPLSMGSSSTDLSFASFAHFPRQASRAPCAHHYWLSRRTNIGSLPDSFAATTRLPRRRARRNWRPRRFQLALPDSRSR